MKHRTRLPSRPRYPVKTNITTRLTDTDVAPTPATRTPFTEPREHPIGSGRYKLEDTPLNLSSRPLMIMRGQHGQMLVGRLVALKLNSAPGQHFAVETYIRGFHFMALVGLRHAKIALPQCRKLANNQGQDRFIYWLPGAESLSRSPVWHWQEWLDSPLT